MLKKRKFGNKKIDETGRLHIHLDMDICHNSLAKASDCETDQTHSSSDVLQNTRLDLLELCAELCPNSLLRLLALFAPDEF